MSLLSVTGTPLTDENGDLSGGVVVFRDITLQKETDQEIRRLNSELERRVAERTRDLAYMNSELEALCHSVSHDLRRPLRHIDGFSLELSDRYGKCLDEKGLEFLHKVREGAQRMGRLIDALLQLSRTTRGDIRRRRMDLSETARKIASDFQRKKPQRKVQFQIAEGMNVEGDPELLQVVLENLIGNAWKFTSKRPTARIEFGAKQINGVDTYFLRDDGVGFDPAFASKLFSPFERLHREREYDGNGIGLATVQRVVMRHGGHVWAESQPNDGAIFFFTLCGTPSSSDYLDDSDRGSG